jgi:isocitrate/isopropylmalate dehydrogenase
MQDELELKIRILKSLRFFKDVQPFVLIPLANQLLHETKGMDEVIVREGQKLEYMHILYKGSCNVIRTTLTKRTKRPMLESKGAMVGLGDFRTTRVNTPREDQRRFLSHNTYL